MLSCNVVVQETENGEIEVTAVDPVVSMSAVNNPELAGIAGKIQRKLKSVIAQL